MLPSARRTWRDRLRRASCAACRPAPCPRPSAIASAKLANSTVNHRNSGDQSGEHVLGRSTTPRSLKNRTVVSTAPTPTTNMTGLRISVRGFSLRKLSMIARRIIAGSRNLFGAHEAWAAVGSSSDLQCARRSGRARGREGTRGRRRPRPRRSRASRRAACRSGRSRPSPAPSACGRPSPPSASVGMIRKKRPNSMQMPSVVFIQSRVRGDAGERRAVVVRRRRERVQQLAEAVGAGVEDGDVVAPSRRTSIRRRSTSPAPA